MDLRNQQTRSFARAFGGIAVAFGTVLFKQNRSGGNGVRIVLQWIRAVPSLFGCLLQFRVDGWIVFGQHAGGRLIGVPTLRKNNCHHEKGTANGECSGNGFHLRPPNSRLTIEPKPVISRETPQRIKNRWLLSFRPKPGETRNVQPDGKFQPRTGAR